LGCDGDVYYSPLEFVSYKISGYAHSRQNTDSIYVPKQGTARSGCIYYIDGVPVGMQLTQRPAKVEMPVNEWYIDCEGNVHASSVKTHS
jgi:hypothetical protein